MSKLPFEEPSENGKPIYCMGCPLYEAPGPVFGPAPRKADILFLGEAPGKDECGNWKVWKDDPERNWRNPNFTGGAGRVLYKWCSQVGLNRDANEVRNVVKCRPTQVTAEGKTVDRAPTEEEIRHCAFYLAKELGTIRPNLIVALGVSALYVTTGRTQIGTYHGQLCEGSKRHDDETKAYKVLPIYHPAFIMRQQEMWPVAVRALAKAKTESTFPALIRQAVDYNVSGSLRGPASDLVDAARRAGFIVFDFEAEGIEGKKGKGLNLNTGQITMCGFTSQPYKADVLHWTLSTQQLFAQLATDPSIEKVTQNGEGFDIPYAQKRGHTFRGRSFDTLQAYHLTNPEMEKNLAHMAREYTDMEYWKGKQMYQSGQAALMLGNAKDVDSCCRIYLEVKEELRAMDMEWLYYESVMPLQPVLRNMYERGIKRDSFKAFKWSTAVEGKVNEYTTKLLNVLGHDLNLDSPKQLSDLLYTRMGLPVQYRKDKKRGSVPTVNDDALDKLELITKNPIFALINQRRKLKKLKSTFIDLEPDDNDMIHPHFGSAKAALEKGEKGSGARNGRLVSWNPNFQNQPLEVRELYVPDSAEHVFIEADWSQIEWRTAMVLSGEPFGLEVLASGADNHTITAAECFNLSTEEVLRRDAEYSGGHGSPRFETKFIVYGLGYGRGAADIAKQLGRDISWVEQFINRFKNRLPVYWKWRGNLERYVAENAYLRNPFGRRRWWYTRQITEMYNFPPSSTAADMMYLILPRLERELPDGATARLTVHDSVLINSPKDVIRRAVECVRDIMHQRWERIVDYSDRPEVVRKHYPSGWFCPADVHLGNNWRECKKGNKDLEKELLT